MPLTSNGNEQDNRGEIHGPHQSNETQPRCRNPIPRHKLRTETRTNSKMVNTSKQKQEHLHLENHRLRDSERIRS